MSARATIVAAADGSALGNPGPAGWGWYVDADTWASGGWPHGTNNMGELTAVLDLLQQTATDDAELLIYCDSTYVINSITKWMPGWKRKGWRKGDGKPVQNVEIMKALDAAMQGRRVRFEWVKGHAGHELNEAADRLANAAALAFSTGRQPDPGPGFGAARRPDEHARYVPTPKPAEPEDLFSVSTPEPPESTAPDPTVPESPAPGSTGSAQGERARAASTLGPGALPDPVAEVVELVATMPGVEAVVLGGSRASGTATADSDWDLGVYYRGVPDLTALARLGEVHPPGSWGRLMNGGAWLSVAGIRIDALLRDLDVVEYWTAEARDGRFEVDGLLGYLAGFPTYTLTAELASSVLLRGALAVPTGYPAALAAAAPPNWRFRRDFALAHARRAAELGNQVVALGQLARACVEEAHARHSERATWMLNEKRIFDGTGLWPELPLEPTFDVRGLVERVADLLVAG